MDRRYASGRVDVQRLMKDYEESGLSRRGFCENIGLPVTTFDYYRRRFLSGQRNNLIPVKVLAEESAGEGFGIVLRNGRRIESGWEFPEAALLRLVRVLEQL